MAKAFYDAKTGEIFGGLDEFGHEIPDPRPLAIPTDLGRPETLAEQVQRLVRSASREIASQTDDIETFEESEDFDVDDDFDPATPYELHFDPVLGKEVSAQMVLNNRDRYASATIDKFAEQEEPNQTSTLEANGSTIDQSEPEKSSEQSSE